MLNDWVTRNTNLRTRRNNMDSSKNNENIRKENRHEITEYRSKWNKNINLPACVVLFRVRRKLVEMVISSNISIGKRRHNNEMETEQKEAEDFISNTSSKHMTPRIQGVWKR